MASAAPPGRFLSIHYLRAIAAIMVVIYHVFARELVTAPDDAVYDWLRQGVAIFFVISGFVMVSSTASGVIGPRQFLARRLQRVVPLYWLATLFFALCSVTPEGRHLLASLLFLPMLDATTGAARLPLLDVGWTLNFEMAFYALFALSLLLPRRVALGLLSLLLILSPALPLIVAVDPRVAFYLDPIIWDFVVGMAIAYFGLRLPAWGLPLGFALLVLLPQLSDWRVVAVTMPAALIVASARSLDGRLRAYPLPLLLGDASYAIYLAHLFVIVALVGSPIASASPALVAGLALIGSIAIGMAVHLAVEVPLSRLFRRTGSPATIAAAAQALPNSPATKASRSLNF